MDREGAAKIYGMDRQTLRDWVHRFNALGPEGLIDTPGEATAFAAVPILRVIQPVVLGLTTRMRIQQVAF
jgi:hypothetical protein